MKSLSFEDASQRKGGLLCEKRIFLKSGDGTRFVRLRARDQIIGWCSGTLLVAWTVTATALLAVQYTQGNATREQAAADREVYETRITALAAERDRRHMEALAAQDQFATLLNQLSGLQTRIFDSELAAKEKAQEVSSLREQLSTTQAALDVASRSLGDTTSEGSGAPSATLALMTDALADMTEERAALTGELSLAEAELADLHLTMRLEAEKNDRIFRKLEDAVSVSMEPLDGLFAKVGIDSDRILDTMRNRYNGQGGPLDPVSLSTKGLTDPDAERATNILVHMQELNLYRMAIDALPMAMPVPRNTRLTSPFGPRRDPIHGGRRMHSGIDWAGPYGTPIKATADGVVTFVGWQSGYGRIIKIKHEFGIETRYAHLAKFHVKVGQKVSKGDKIGAMGNSGRSTGTHLHYEVRVGGKAMNPMSYITAAKDVF